MGRNLGSSKISLLIIAFFLFVISAFFGVIINDVLIIIISVLINTGIAVYLYNESKTTGRYSKASDNVVSLKGFEDDIETRKDSHTVYTQSQDVESYNNEPIKDYGSQSVRPLVSRLQGGRLQ